MRDINRIKPFLEKVEEYWQTVPDWRFGQLMMNFLGSLPIDPFFPEDDKMIEYMDEYFKRYKKKEE